MSYDLKQQLNHINDENYDDDISANVNEGQFIAVTANVYDSETGVRTLTVQIMDLDGAPGGEVYTNSGLFVRQEGEKSVTANLLDDQGQQVDTNTVDYS